MPDKALWHEVKPKTCHNIFSWIEISWISLVRLRDIDTKIMCFHSSTYVALTDHLASWQWMYAHVAGRLSLFTYLCLCMMIGRWWRLLRCVEEALCFSVSSRSVGQSDGINGWQRAEWWGQWDMRQGVKSLPCRPLTHSWEDWLLENIINSQRSHNYLSSRYEF